MTSNPFGIPPPGCRRLRAAIVATLLAAGVGVSTFAPSARTLAAPTQAIDRTVDFVRLRQWIDVEQSFTAETRAAAVAALAELQNGGPLSQAAFYMGVRRVVGFADNGHSNVTTTPIYQNFGMLPIRTYWFSNGLYVVRARNDHAQLVGVKIKKIDGLSVGKVQKALLAYHGGTSAMFRRYASVTMMLSPPLLHAIGLAESPSQLTLRVRSAGSRAFDVVVRSEPGPVAVGRTSPWRYLSPEALPGEGDDWSTAVERRAPTPLRLRDTGSTARYEMLDGGIAYVQLRSNIRIESFVAATQAQLALDRPRSIIFDNRDNPGGNLNLTGAFASGLPGMLGAGGRVYTLTGGGTFSAGIYSAFFPQAANDARTLVVGQIVGDATRFFAETGAAFVLPQSRYQIGYALQLHDIGAGCAEPNCHLSIGNPLNIAVGSVAPELPVAEKFADYAAGRDAVMDRVLAEEAKRTR